MSNVMLWEMSEADANLLHETLHMDSISHSFDPVLRESIRRALKRVKTYYKDTYDALKMTEGRVMEADKVLNMIKEKL